MASERLRSNLWFAYLCLLICWGAQAYLLIGQWLFEGSLFAHMENGRPYISDFVNVYSMAYLANRSLHEHVNFYDPILQAETAKTFTAPVIAEVPFTFQYPPWFFPLLMPLSHVSISNAFLIWDLIGIALIAWAVYILAFGFHKSNFSRVFVMVAVFASYPTWLCLRLGQTAWINFAALTVFWWLIGQRKSFLAGLAASVFTMKFQYLPLPFLVGLMRGRLKFALGFSLVTALLLALTLLTIGWENIACYPQVILGIGVGKNVSGVSPELMQNLRGALVLITNADNPSPDALGEYAKLAAPAIQAGGGRFVVRGMPSKTYEAGLNQRTVIIEFDSVERAVAAHDSDGYKAALKALGNAAERDIRIVEGVA